MKSFKDFEPSVQCDECDKHLLIGDNPNNPIFETCDDCVKRKKHERKKIYDQVYRHYELLFT